MSTELNLSRSRMTTPRAAAIAGILFSILLMSSLVLIRLSVPANSADASAWTEDTLNRATFALRLIPFAGIFFLWFIGVIRTRLGAREDKLFATLDPTLRALVEAGRLCEDLGMSVNISCKTGESSVACAAALHAAAVIPNLDWALTLMPER